MNADNLGGFYNAAGSSPPDASMYPKIHFVLESLVLMARQLCNKFPLAALFTEALEVLQLMAATFTSAPLEDLFMPTNMA
jgi:hypothetical protein